MNFAPFGITRSDPPIPTGTIGTPAFTATYTAPSNSGCTTGLTIAEVVAEVVALLAAAEEVAS